MEGNSSGTHDLRAVQRNPTGDRMEGSSSGTHDLRVVSFSLLGSCHKASPAAKPLGRRQALPSGCMSSHLGVTLGNFSMGPWIQRELLWVFLRPLLGAF